jgi:hypothetical protein
MPMDRLQIGGIGHYFKGNLGRAGIFPGNSHNGK